MPKETIELEGIGQVVSHFSTEYLQDVEIQMRMLRQFRTVDLTQEEIDDWKSIYYGPAKVDPDDYDKSEECVTWREMLGCHGPGHRSPILTDEITEQEIAEWGQEYERFKKIDLDAVRKKYNVKFESEDDEPPYTEYDNPWQKPKKPVQWPAESSIFPWVEEIAPRGFPLDDFNFFANPETYGPRS